MSAGLLFTNVRLVDPASGRDGPGSLAVSGGVITAVADDLPVMAGAQVIDGHGAVLAPGLIDTRVFAADSASAAAGGITRLCLMPDQSPVIDDAATVRATLDEANGIHLIGAATKGLSGSEIAEIGLMLGSGACAVATGRGAVASAAVMHRLLQYAGGLGVLVVSHSEDPALTHGACATEGELASRLGLPSAPAFAEALAMARDIRLAEATGARLHIGQVTTAEGLAQVRAAKARGVALTCGVTPAHLLLGDMAIGDYRTFARVSPPLRSEDDRQAVMAALADGTIDVIASGHDPRSDEGKRLPFAEAEPGMAGLETLLPLALVPVHDGRASLAHVLARLTLNPARLFGLPGGVLEAGAPADLVLFDPDAPWRINAAALVSPARNTAFDGLPVQGRVLGTWRAGERIFARS